MFITISYNITDNRRCQGNIEISGWGVVREDEDVIVV